MKMYLEQRNFTDNVLFIGEKEKKIWLKLKRKKKNLKPN